MSVRANHHGESSGERSASQVPRIPGLYLDVAQEVVSEALALVGLGATATICGDHLSINGASRSDLLIGLVQIEQRWARRIASLDLHAPDARRLDEWSNAVLHREHAETLRRWLHHLSEASISPLERWHDAILRQEHAEALLEAVNELLGEPSADASLASPPTEVAPSARQGLKSRGPLGSRDSSDPKSWGLCRQQGQPSGSEVQTGLVRIPSAPGRESPSNEGKE